MATKLPEFAASQSERSYGVVHRVAGERHGHMISFCQKRKIIDPRPIVWVRDLRGASLCALCFRMSDRHGD